MTAQLQFKDTDHWWHHPSWKILDAAWLLLLLLRTFAAGVDDTAVDTLRALLHLVRHRTRREGAAHSNTVTWW